MSPEHWEGIELVHVASDVYSFGVLLYNLLTGDFPFQGRTVHSKEVLDELKSTFGEQVFETVVRHTVRLAEAPMAGRSILHYEKASPHAAAFRHLAKEVRVWLTTVEGNGQQ